MAAACPHSPRPANFWRSSIPSPPMTHREKRLYDISRTYRGRSRLFDPPCTLSFFLLSFFFLSSFFLLSFFFLSSFFLLSFFFLSSFFLLSFFFLSSFFLLSF